MGWCSCNRPGPFLPRQCCGKWTTTRTRTEVASVRVGLIKARGEEEEEEVGVGSFRSEGGWRRAPGEEGVDVDTRRVVEHEEEEEEGGGEDGGKST